MPAQQRVHQLVDGARGHLLGDGEVAQLLGALDHERAAEQQLSGRRRHRVEERLLRALARRIELADRLHLVAEQLDAQRPLALGREEIEDVAPHRELARLLDERHALVARGQEHLDQRVAIERLPHLEVYGARAHRLARGNAQHQRRPGRHHHGRGLPHGRCAVAGPGAGQPAVEDVHALRHHEGLGREALVGLGVVAREGAHAPALRRLAQRRAQVVEEGVAGLGVGHQHEHRPLAVRPHELRGDDTARRPPQPAEPHGALPRHHLRDHVVERLEPARLRGFVRQIALCTHKRPAAPPRRGVGRRGLALPPRVSAARGGR